MWFIDLAFTSAKLINLIPQVTQDFRLSYGLGLALKLGGVARIELNYCVPVKVRP